MNPSFAPTSPWVIREPSLLVGLSPSIAFRFANAAVDGNETSVKGDPDMVSAPYIYRIDEDGRKLSIATDANRAAQLSASRSENPLLDLGKGVALRQPFNVSSILHRPVEVVKIIGTKTLPDPIRLITSAATFENAYFQEPSLIDNQPMLLDVDALRTDANGQTRVINFWNDSGVESLGEDDVADYFRDPAKYFTFVRLTAIDGSDALRDSLAEKDRGRDKSWATPKAGVPTGVPTAIIPTSTLLTSIFQSMPNIERVKANLPLIVEEAISKTLLQHPMLCGLSFDSATFHVAVGMPKLGTEVVIVTVEKNEIQPTQAERDAFTKVYADLGNAKVEGEAKKKQQQEVAASKANSIASILKSPFVLGLDQQFNVAEASAVAPAAPAAIVKTPTELEMANSYLAKCYSSGLYVVTIVYKKSFDVTHATDALGGLYADWIHAAQPEARGTYAPHAARKVSMSVIRSAFAQGITPPNVEGLQNYASRVDTFLGLKLKPSLALYNPLSGEFDFFKDSIGGGTIGSNFFTSGMLQPVYNRQPSAQPVGQPPARNGASRVSPVRSAQGQMPGAGSSVASSSQVRNSPIASRISPVAQRIGELAPVIPPAASPVDRTTLASFDQAIAEANRPNAEAQASSSFNAAAPSRVSPSFVKVETPAQSSRTGGSRSNLIGPIASENLGELNRQLEELQLDVADARSALASSEAQYPRLARGQVISEGESVARSMAAQREGVLRDTISRKSRQITAIQKRMNELQGKPSSRAPQIPFPDDVREQAENGF